jgi:mono/diheme cytochrome c family protein/plastocyanin
MNAERIIRLLVVLAVVGVPTALIVGSILPGASDGLRAVEMHGRMAEDGGWTPDEFTMRVGETVRLRLTSDDVMHGFAVGQQDEPRVDVKPGQVAEVNLSFDRPGRYVFYCTRWCGPNHWRMRGTITVEGPSTATEIVSPPLYETLGIDIDAPHPAAVVPTSRPSAPRGQALQITLPTSLTNPDYVRSHSPADLWQALRHLPATGGLADDQMWDLVAMVWQSQTTAEEITQGQQLYAASCAACHGERGQGDGVMAWSLEPGEGVSASSGTQPPANQADPRLLLGASPALLEGKILRGGMGTGMPYWGPIFTPEQIEALVDYLYSLHFDMEVEP